MRKLLPLVISATLGSVVTTSAWAESLAQIYDLAKQNDPTLLGAKADRDQAFEAINSSRSSLLPQIDLDAGYDIERSDLSSLRSDALTAGVSLTQALYDPSSWVALDSSEKLARQQDASYASAQQDLIIRVAQAYFDILEAEDNLNFVRAEKKAVYRQLDQIKQRFEVGLTAITDVHDAQAQYDSVLADEVQAQNTLTNSYEALREITGQEPNTLSKLDTQRFSASKPSASLADLLKDAETKNLSLLSARIAQDIAKDDIKSAKTGHLPTLDFTADYDYTDQQNSDASYFGSRNELAFGLDLNVPLYSGGNTTSLVKQAEYAYVSTSQTLEKTYRSVVKNVHAYNNNITGAIGSIRAYQQSVISAKSALEATEAGYEVGTRTIVDVLDATQTLYDARSNLSSARYDYIMSVLELRQAVGTLSEQDVLDISAGLID